MSYCINPDCQNPQNPAHLSGCQSCGSHLRLKDRYRVIKVLGQSASSRTFLAVDEDKPSQPHCAIKQILDPGLDRVKQKTSDVVNPRIDSTVHLRATELDRLGKHPLLPELWAAFEDQGNQYYVYEYIRGRNLATELCHDGVFQEVQIWQLLNEILPILEFIHANSWVHADLKPENIIRRSYSSLPVQLSDVEQQLVLVDFGSAISLEDTAATLGEKGHGSAEYGAPEQLKGQARTNSDLYSLGVICLHLLTQVPPFDLFDVKSNTWTWRDYLKRPVSYRLGRILDRLVQRNPTQRYQSAAEVIQDVKQGPGLVLSTLSPRQKVMLTAWGGAVVALASLILSSLPSPVSRVSTTAPDPIYRLPDTRLMPPQIKRVRPYLLQKAPLVRTLRRNTSPVWSITVSPNGQMVASGNTDGTIQVLEIKTGKVLQTLAGHSGPVGTLAISPNGRLLVSGSGDHTIKVWDLWSGKLLKMLNGHQGWVYNVAFSPDGQTIASVSRDQTLRLWDVHSGRELAQLQGYADDIQSLAFSPDNHTLVSGDSDGMIEIWNWRTGRLVRTVKGHSRAIWSMAISPDGRTLASGSWDRSIKLWNLSQLQSQYFSSLPEQTLVGHSDKLQSLSFSPDSQTLASGDFAGTVKLWQINSGRLMGTLKGHKSWVDVEFNPYGDELVSGSFDDTIKVWQLSP